MAIDMELMRRKLATLRGENRDSAVRERENSLSGLSPMRAIRIFVSYQQMMVTH